MNRRHLRDLVAQVERQELSRRSFLGAATALGVSLLIADRALAAGSVQLDVRFAAATQAESDGIVIISNELGSSIPRNFNPLGPTATNVRYATRAHMYESLLVWDPLRSELMQSLASGYEYSADGRVLTFHLLSNVQWSDGEPFSAADVVFTWDLLKGNDQLSGSGARAAFPMLDSWEAVDDVTVRFTFTEVFNPGLFAIANEVVVPKHIWEGVENPATYTNENPVATGPFTEVTRFDAQVYEVGPNPHYRFADRLKIKGTRYPILVDNTARGLALRNGELDWASIFIPDVENVFIAREPDKRGYWFPLVSSTVMLWPNTQKAPFDDANVRKALSMALDRPQLCDIAMWGYTTPADATGLGPSYDDQKSETARSAAWTERNLDEAGRLLDKAGLTLDGDVRTYNGQPWEFALTVPSDASDFVQATDLITQSLADVGVRVRIDAIELRSLQEKINQGQHELAIIWAATGGPSVYEVYRATMSAATAETATGATSENYSRWSSPEADALLAEYASASDPSDRQAISEQLQELFADNLPAIPLFYGPEWSEYTTYRVIGFPNEGDPYAQPTPIGQVCKHVLLHLHPIDEDAPQIDDIYLAAAVIESGGATPEASPVD